jgi:hypothetical protein
VTAWLFLIGVAVGFVLEHVWSFCVEMIDLYREERGDDPRKPC